MSISFRLLKDPSQNAILNNYPSNSKHCKQELNNRPSNVKYCIFKNKLNFPLIILRGSEGIINFSNNKRTIH